MESNDIENVIYCLVMRALEPVPLCMDDGIGNF